MKELRPAADGVIVQLKIPSMRYSCDIKATQSAFIMTKLKLLDSLLQEDRVTEI